MRLVIKVCLYLPSVPAQFLVPSLPLRPSFLPPGRRTPLGGCSSKCVEGNHTPYVLSNKLRRHTTFPTGQRNQRRGNVTPDTYNCSVGEGCAAVACRDTGPEAGNQQKYEKIQKLTESVHHLCCPACIRVPVTRHLTQKNFSFVFCFLHYSLPLYH